MFGIDCQKPAIYTAHCRALITSYLIEFCSSLRKASLFLFYSTAQVDFDPGYISLGSGKEFHQGLMSRRSYDSFAHERRLSKYRVSDDDLFEYVLELEI